MRCSNGSTGGFDHRQDACLRPRGIKKNTAKGKSRGGWTTKIHALVDASGRVLNAVLTAGQINDITPASTTVSHHRPKQLLGDRGYDSNPLRRWLRNRGIRPVIPGRSNRLRAIRHDRNAYKRRFRVEHFFSRLKQWSGLALRREKSDDAFLALVQLFAIKDGLQPHFV